jgi:membrane-associated phospholipid phosphatase
MYKLALLMTAVAPLGELALVLPFAAVLVAWCWLSGDRRGARAIGLSIGGTLLSVGLLKLATNLALSPWQPHWSAISNLFPSGHVAMAIIVYGALVLCVRRSLPWLGWPMGAAVAIMLLLLAVERVASGSHPPLDVVVGAALGAGALLVLIRLWPSGGPRATGLPAVVVAGVAIAYALYGVQLPTSEWVATVASRLHAVSVLLGRL